MLYLKITKRHSVGYFPQNVDEIRKIGNSSFHFHSFLRNELAFTEVMEKWEFGRYCFSNSDYT